MNKNIWRSILAVIAGAAVSIVLATGTDAVMQKTAVFPESGRMMSNGLFVLRLMVCSCAFDARLAPSRPMTHALMLGAIGTVIGILGVVVTWNKMPELEPRWYPIALAALGMLQSWIGGNLRVMQLVGMSEL